MNNRKPELKGREWRLDQMTFAVLSFRRHLPSLSGKEHWDCSVWRKGKFQGVYLKSWLAGMAV
jgi:hypothetical protein